MFVVPEALNLGERRQGLFVGGGPEKKPKPPTKMEIASSIYLRMSAQKDVTRKQIGLTIGLGTIGANFVVACALAHDGALGGHHTSVKSAIPFSITATILQCCQPHAKPRRMRGMRV